MGSPKNPSRIPSLDGLRAVSIGAVILGHVAETNGFPLSIPGLEHFGNMGVKVFFVISGFLITTLLLNEQASHGRISLSKFYARRTIRIFPAFYAYIAAMLLAEMAHLIVLPHGDLLHAVTYTMNFHRELGLEAQHRGWYLNHLWSLSVEEQFYLLWPATLAICTRRRGLQIAGATIVVAPFIRLWMWVHGAHVSELTRQFQAVADVLATGCVLAGMHEWLGRQRRYMALLSSPLFFLVPGVLLGVSFASYFVRPMVFYVVGQSVANVAIAIAIDRCVRMGASGIVGRILNWRPVVFVGVLSYSLYLWQEPFLNPMASLWPHTFPQNILLVIVASLASYYLVEIQALKLRKRFAP
jgi:peptidoglycan/LPS O-acetylase OafA/YrhL